MKPHESNPNEKLDPENSFVAEDTATEDRMISEELKALDVAAKDWNDKYLRAMADIDNLRKRTKRDLEQAGQYAIQDFAGRILPVKDAMERGLAHAAESEAGDSNALLEGVQSTLRLLTAAFADSGLQEIDPVGDVFNPEFHEAFSVRHESGVEPDLVLSVFEKGYLLNGRLIRAAKVEVSRDPIEVDL
jgi:molecular chaperone GrpE